LDLKAQDTTFVESVDEIIKGDFIEPYTNKWQVSLIDTSGTKTTVRFWTDYTQILELNGVDYLHRVQDLYGSDNELQETWINIVEHKSLVPLRFTSQNASGGMMNLDFSPEEIIVKSNADDQVYAPQRFEISQQLYDWNLYGMLLVGLPFKEGEIYKIPFWSQAVSSVDYVTTEAEGKEMIKTLTGASISTQKNTTDKGLTFWLTKEKPYVIQLELQLPTGATMLWEMM
jgi:hypothetical protein